MLDPNTLLSGLPPGLRTPLIDAYSEIARNYAERRWEPAELNGGKLSEVVYTILDGATSAAFAAAPKKPKNMVDACKEIEQRPANPARPGDRSIRVLLPRLLPYLYEIRNNRNVGHVGGDVDPNFSDATAVFSCGNWLLAELVRIFHGVALEEAQLAVDALVERRHPIVWEVDGLRRVLDHELSAADQVLLLLYSSRDPMHEDSLRASVEYASVSKFRSRILAPLHKTRIIEYNQTESSVRISPRGVQDVESRLLPRYRA